MTRARIIFKGLVLIMATAVVVFNMRLYLLCEKQKTDIAAIENQQQIQAKINNNQFKYQQDTIERLSRDLDDARQQIKEQKGVLSAQNDDNKSIQTSLMDLKAEADAIKEDMKGWQKDYVGVLAELNKKMDDTQNHTKNLEDSLTALNLPELKGNIQSLKAAIEKLNRPADNSTK